VALAEAGYQRRLGRLARTRPSNARRRGQTCFELADRYRDGSIVTVVKWANDSRDVARLSGGRFQMIETVEARDAEKLVIDTEAIDALVQLPGLSIFRRELLWAVLDSLRDVGNVPPAGLEAALRTRRSLASSMGRRLARCSAGTTLLVKGMEFDHGIVVHTGGPDGFSANNLYVALTRAAKIVDRRIGRRCD
jgi:hypothetical protein